MFSALLKQWLHSQYELLLVQLTVEPADFALLSAVQSNEYFLLLLSKLIPSENVLCLPECLSARRSRQITKNML